MRNRKVTTGGVVLLVIAALIIVIGFSGVSMVRPTGLGHELYGHAVERQANIDALNDALEEAVGLQEKLDIRIKAAAEDTQAAADAAAEAAEVLNNGEFGKSDLDVLGGELYAIQSDAPDAYAAYTQLYNAEALKAIDTADKSVKKIHKTITQVIDAEAAMRTAWEQLAVVDGLPEIPAATGYALPDGDIQTQIGALQAGVTAAQADIDVLTPVLTEDIATAQNVLAECPLTMMQSIVFIVQARAWDIVIIGAVLALAAAVMIAKSAWVAKQWKLKVFRHSIYLGVTVALAALALRYAPGETWALMRQGVFDSLYMTIPATIAAYALGLPLGVILVITSADHIRPNASVNAALGTVINFLRSIPFVILLVMLFDVTRIVMGTAIGTRAIIFPLFVSAFPYVARVVEGSLNEVDRGVIEAAESMGSTTWQIIRKVLLPEALPSLINGAAITTTTILAYTAMAGAAGGDGLGKIAITYGLNYRDYEVMYIASLLLVALVQIIQIAGDILNRACDHRKK